MFRFTFGFLKQLADNMLSNILRDLPEFTDRGFNDDKKAEFQEAIHQFDDFPTDEQLQGIQMDKTQAKNNFRKSIETPMRTILLAAKNVFGEGTGKYREFGNHDLTKQTDDVLVRNTKSLSKTATKYLTDLATEGITAAKIDSLNATIVQFDEAIDQQRDAIKNRDNSTEDRAVLANNLYALVIKYAETGRDIWRTTSESKYNDYAIYNTQSGGPETETPAAG